MKERISVPTTDVIVAAARHLRAGGLVGMPTETVYGLAADAENSEAVTRIYQSKNRPSDHPLIVHILSAERVDAWATNPPEYARKLMAEFWPGPMTLILNRSARAKDFITGGQPTVGLRVPNHKVALNLLREFAAQGGHGLAAPSANRYGAISPTSAQAVAAELGGYLAAEDLILDGGSSQVGVESTIIDCTGPNPVVLRPGAITASDIELCTGIVVGEPSNSSIRVSGSHKQHYSPKAEVIVGGIAQAGEGLIAEASVSSGSDVVRLAAPESVEQYARELYGAMRKADAMGLSKLRIVPPQGAGLALAIQDRITRAAAKG